MELKPVQVPLIILCNPAKRKRVSLFYGYRNQHRSMHSQVINWIASLVHIKSKINEKLNKKLLSTRNPTNV